VAVDEGSAVAESDETNNTFVRRFGEGDPADDEGR
jgi:subtilase family serine protease